MFINNIISFAYIVTSYLSLIFSSTPFFTFSDASLFITPPAEAFSKPFTGISFVFTLLLRSFFDFSSLIFWFDYYYRIVYFCTCSIFLENYCLLFILIKFINFLLKELSKIFILLMNSYIIF